MDENYFTNSEQVEVEFGKLKQRIKSIQKANKATLRTNNSHNKISEVSFCISKEKIVEYSLIDEHEEAFFRKFSGKWNKAHCKNYLTKMKKNENSFKNKSKKKKNRFGSIQNCSNEDSSSSVFGGNVSSVEQNGNHYKKNKHENKQFTNCSPLLSEVKPSMKGCSSEVSQDSLVFEESSANQAIKEKLLHTKVKRSATKIKNLKASVDCENMSEVIIIGEMNNTKADHKLVRTLNNVTRKYTSDPESFSLQNKRRKPAIYSDYEASQIKLVKDRSMSNLDKVKEKSIDSDEYDVIYVGSKNLSMDIMSDKSFEDESNLNHLLHEKGLHFYPIESHETSNKNLESVKTVDDCDWIISNKPISKYIVHTDKCSLSDKVCEKDSSVSKIPELIDISSELQAQVNCVNYQIKNESYDSVPPLWNFEKEPVDFDIPLLHRNETLTIRNEKELLKYNDVKSGTWSQEEERILEKNFKDFTLKFGVSDPLLLLGIGRQSYNKFESANVSRFIKAKHFYVRLGKNLGNRTLESIYKKARKLLDPFKNSESCVETDLPKILELHKQFGSKWCFIGKKLKRSAQYCYEVFTEYKRKSLYASGKWSVEEDERLIHSIQSVSQSKDLSKVKNIDWVKVAKCMQTRSKYQCQDRWSLNTCSKFKNCQQWNTECFKKLICILKNDYIAKKNSKIDWSEIYQFFKNVAPSEYFIRGKWFYLKTRSPEEVKHNYNDLLNYLFKKYVL